MGLPLFVTPKEGESSTSNTRVPALPDWRGIAYRAAVQDMETWSSSSSSPPFADQSSAERLNYFPVRISLPSRLAPRSGAHGSPPETAGTALLLLESSDSGEADDSDYTDDSDFEDEEVIATDYGWRIKLDLYGDYTITRDFPDPDGSFAGAEEVLRRTLLTGLDRIRQDNSDLAEPIRRGPELASDIGGFYANGDVPPLPPLLPEAHTETREERMSPAMALNIHGLTDTFTESSSDYVAVLEQGLDRAREELYVTNQELAETKEKLAAREEQIRRIRAILEGLYVR